MSKQLTFYAGKDSPFTTRVEIVLREAGAEFIKHEFDFSNGDKPEWYTEKVNPLGKFPVVTYGPPHPKEQPCSDSIKINESLVIMEFIADLYPHVGLIPKDPLQRAKARVFASFIDSVLLQTLADTSFFGKSDISEIFKAFDVVQSHLPDDSLYASGNEFTIADSTAASVFTMVGVVLSNDIGTFKQGEGLKVYEVYNSSKYDKLRGYMKRILDRESVKATIDSVYMKENMCKRFGRGD